MNIFTSDEIIKIIDALIGPTEAVGESHIDEKIAKKLDTLCEITDWCLDQLHYSSKTKDRPEYSMAKIGKCAEDYLRGVKAWAMKRE